MIGLWFFVFCLFCFMYGIGFALNFHNRLVKAGAVLLLCGWILLCTKMDLLILTILTFLSFGIGSMIGEVIRRVKTRY